MSEHVMSEKDRQYLKYAMPEVHGYIAQLEAQVEQRDKEIQALYKAIDRKDKEIQVLREASDE